MSRTQLNLRTTFAFGLVAMLAVASSSAQYAYDPSNADEQGPGIRYFGAVKDSRGAHVAGATVVISDHSSRFLFVTDEAGRFRGMLPPETVLAQVELKCFKMGYQLVRVTKRPGPANAKPTVQVDCLLRVAETS